MLRWAGKILVFIASASASSASARLLRLHPLLLLLPLHLCLLLEQHAVGWHHARRRHARRRGLLHPWRKTCGSSCALLLDGRVVLDEVVAVLPPVQVLPAAASCSCYILGEQGRQSSVSRPRLAPSARKPLPSILTSSGCCCSGTSRRGRKSSAPSRPPRPARDRRRARAVHWQSLVVRRAARARLAIALSAQRRSALRRFTLGVLLSVFCALRSALLRSAHCSRRSALGARRLPCQPASLAGPPACQPASLRSALCSRSALGARRCAAASAPRS